MRFEYPAYESPVGLNFGSFNTKERQVFFQWFLDEWLNRVLILKERVERDSGSCKWGTRDSVEQAAAWIKKNSEKVERSDFEIAQMLDGGSPYPYEYFRWTASEEAIAMGLDLGLLFALDMLAHNDELNWAIIEGPKSLVDRNHPGLHGISLKVPYSPFLVGSNLVFGLILRDESVVKAGELWTKLLQGVSAKNDK